MRTAMKTMCNWRMLSLKDSQHIKGNCQSYVSNIGRYSITWPLMKTLLCMVAICSSCTSYVEKCWASYLNYTREHLHTRHTVYWSGIDNLISQCQQCQRHVLANPKEPMLTKLQPSHPFEELAADFCCHVGQCYCRLPYWLVHYSTYGQRRQCSSSDGSSKGTV